MTIHLQKVSHGYSWLLRLAYIGLWSNWSWWGFSFFKKKSVSLLDSVLILNCGAFSEISIFKEITPNPVKSNIEKLYSNKNSGHWSGAKKSITIKFCPSHQYIPVFQVTNMSVIVFCTHLLLRVFSFGSSVKTKQTRKTITPRLY